MAVTVYTKPGCVQCKATYSALDKEGIEYTVIDLTEDPVAHAHVMSLGYLQAPVVVAGDQHWSGFRRDRIKALTNREVFADQVEDAS
jgi:glutaredoxin-like protein NrdH